MSEFRKGVYSIRLKLKYTFVSKLVKNLNHIKLEMSMD